MKKMLTLLSVAALSLGAAEQMPLPSGKAEFAPTEKSICRPGADAGSQN